MPSQLLAIPFSTSPYEFQYLCLENVRGEPPDAAKATAAPAVPSLICSFGVAQPEHVFPSSAAGRAPKAVPSARSVWGHRTCSPEPRPCTSPHLIYS